MICNTSLIELAGRYLGRLKCDFYTFEEFDAKICALLDLLAYDTSKDEIKVRDAIIIIRQVGEKWK